MSEPSKLNHLAIILDGNRRWASQHGLKGDSIVYKEGGQKISPIVEQAFKLGVECVSLWVGSYSNLVNRSKAVLRVLDSAYEKKFKELADSDSIQKNEVKIEVIGEWRDLLSKKCIASAERAIDVTKHYTKRTLVVLVGYDGLRERGLAVESLLKNSPAAPSNPRKAELLLRSYAQTGHLPNVDLVIRTGAWLDPHNSAGFLGFLTADSQYSFPKVLWPDFTPTMLKSIFDDFVSRERRYGK